jgi:hypothetical protein
VQLKGGDGSGKKREDPQAVKKAAQEKTESKKKKKIERPDLVGPRKPRAQGGFSLSRVGISAGAPFAA